MQISLPRQVVSALKRTKFFAKIMGQKWNMKNKRSPNSWASAQTSIESAGLPMWNTTSGDPQRVKSHMSLRTTQSSKTYRSRSILAKCLAHEKWLMREGVATAVLFAVNISKVSAVLASSLTWGVKLGMPCNTEAHQFRKARINQTFPEWSRAWTLAPWDLCALWEVGWMEIETPQRCKTHLNIKWSKNYLRRRSSLTGSRLSNPSLGGGESYPPEGLVWAGKAGRPAAVVGNDCP